MNLIKLNKIVSEFSEELKPRFWKALAESKTQGMNGESAIIDALEKIGLNRKNLETWEQQFDVD